MPALVTDWKTIGTAGDTIDGREITEQDLIDAAEMYDKDEYTAVINSDHMLWLYGNFGHVEDVRLGTDKKDRTILEARLTPNSRLIEKNKAGQGMFFSMELWPNFANSGKTYLSGLAVTDEPASLGTSMLKLFSKQPGGKPERIYAKPCDEQFVLDTEDNDQDSAIKHFAQSFAALFKSSEIPNRQPTAKDPSEDDMSKEALEKLQQQNEKLLSAFTTLNENMAKHFGQETPAGEENPAAGNEAGGDETGGNENTVSSEQFSQLEEQNKTLLASVDKLTETFSQLLKEKPGTQGGQNTGQETASEFV